MRVATDEFYGVNVAADGSILVVGATHPDGTGDTAGLTDKGGYRDAVILKYSSSGTLLWKNNFGGGSNDDFGNVCTVADGYIALGAGSCDFTGDYVGMNHYSNTSLYGCCYAVKYDFNGNLVWKKNLYGFSADIIVATSDGVRIFGNINNPVGYGFLSGFTKPTGSSNYGMVKIDNDGNYVWAGVVNSGSDCELQIKAVAVTDYGYIIAGSSQTTWFGKSNSGTMQAAFVAVDQYCGMIGAYNDTATTNEDTPVNIAVLSNDNLAANSTIQSNTAPSHGTVTLNADNTYTYTPAANYNGTDSFTYRVSNGTGYLEATVNITVTAVNDVPTANNVTASLNEDAVLTGTLTATDTDGDALTFAKASDPSHGTATVASNGAYTYTPAANYNGTDSFTYTASDGKGGVVTRTVSITVNAVTDAPVADNVSASINEDTVLTGTLTATDVDGDTLTFSKASDPSHGTATVASNGAYTYTPADNYNGTDSFTYTVSDGTDSIIKTVSITISSVNDAPVVTDYNLNVNEDGVLTAQLLANDPDGDVLTFSKESDPSHGTLSFSSNGSFTYTPAVNYNGVDSFLFKVTDSNGTSVTKIVNITVVSVNDAPAANNANVSVDEDTTLMGTLTATDVENDTLTYSKSSDPAHGTATVASNGAYTYTPVANYNGTDSFTYTVSDSNGGSDTRTVNITVNSVNDMPMVSDVYANMDEDAVLTDTLAASDIDGDTLIFSKASNPAHGTATVATNGAYTYTPAANYDGTDSFTYTVSDGNGGMVTRTVTVTIRSINDLPISNNINASVDEDNTLTGTLTATDGDGDALTFSKIDDPSHGTATVASDGGYTYTPTANYNGTDSFTFAVSDGKGSVIRTVNITINPVNDTPTANDVDAVVDEDTTLTGTLNGSDIDEDTLTFSKAGNPVHGTASVTSDGAYTYTPEVNYNGTDSFTYTVSDGKGGNVTKTVHITVYSINDIPVVNDVSVSVNEDNTLTGTLTATDVDGDTLTFSRANEPLHGVVTVESDGSYTYTPVLDFNGTDLFTFTVSDGKITVTKTVNITVNPVNDAPITNNVNAAVNEDTQLTGTLTATDIEGDPLTFGIAGDPSHGTATVASNGAYTYTPATNYNGTDSFTYIVSDGNGGSITKTVTVTIDPVNDAPTTSNISITIDEDAVTSITLTGSDVDGDNLTFSKLSNPVHGVLAVNTNGLYTYTPYANYNGSDSFGFTVSDGNGGTVNGVVNITVNPVNDAPFVVNDQITMDQDTVMNLDVLANDTDADSTITITSITQPSEAQITLTAEKLLKITPNIGYYGTFTFTYTVSDGQYPVQGTVTVTVNKTIQVIAADDLFAIDENASSVVLDLLENDILDEGNTYIYAFSDPSHGTLELTILDNGHDALLYTPNPNYSGSDSFTYLLSNGTLESTATVNITINSVNDAPVASADSITTNEDTAYDITLSASDADLDTLSYIIVAQPTHGTLVLKNDHTYTYTPVANYNGSDSFTFKVNDGTTDSNTATVTITVNSLNDVPVVNDTSVNVDEDNTLTGTLTATDADGDTLTFSKAGNPAHGTVTVSSNGSYTYTPAANYNGSDSFTFKVNDGTVDSSTATVLITVNSVNDVPTVSNASVSMNEDNVLNGTLTATDADGDTLTFSKAGNPAHGTVTVSSNGSYTYTPDANYNGSDSFTFTVTDGTDTVTRTVNITVISVNDPVTAANDVITMAQGTAGTLDVLANDTNVDGDVLTLTIPTPPASSIATVTVNSNNTLAIALASSYSGTFIFDYVISDGQYSATGTITVVVTSDNSAPVASNVSVTMDEDTTTSGMLSATDPDGDTITFSKTGDPTHGTATVAANGAYTYTSATNYAGSDSFTYTVTDSRGASVTRTVTITVNNINDKPVGVADSATCTVNSYVDINVLANDTDADAGDTLTVKSFIKPTAATIAIINNGTAIRVTPNSGYTGTFTFRYTVQDAAGTTSLANVTVTVS